MLLVFAIAIIFIIIAITKSKSYEYVKQSSFAVLILMILNCFMMVHIGDDGQGHATYLGFFAVSYDSLGMMYNGSIIVALISLVTYLLSDSPR